MGDTLIPYHTAQIHCGLIAANRMFSSAFLDTAWLLRRRRVVLYNSTLRALVLLKLLRIGRVPALAQQLHRLREQQAMAIGGARGKSWLRGIQVDVPRWCLDVAQARHRERGTNLREPIQQRRTANTHTHHTRTRITRCRKKGTRHARIFQ